MAGVGLAGCIGTGTALEYTEPFEIYIDDTVTALAVETTVGSITIEGDDREDIAVEGEKLAAREADLGRVSLDQSVADGTLTLSADTDDIDNTFLGVQTRPTPDISLTVTVPRSMSISSVETNTGDVDIRRVDGPMTVTSTTGAVTLSSIVGDLEVEVTTGQVDLEDIDGAVDVEATTGSVQVSSVDDSVAVETTTGAIKVDGVAGDLIAETTVGSIEHTDVDGTVTTS